jgi:hypothetical protein
LHLQDLNPFLWHRHKANLQQYPQRNSVIFCKLSTVTWCSRSRPPTIENF